MKVFLMTEIIIVAVFFIASFFEASNFAAFGYGILFGFPYLLYKGLESELYEEANQ